jgi:hypothetical protein
MEAVQCRLRSEGPEPQGEPVSHEPNRRDFLQSAVAALASFILPLGLRASRNNPSFWFIHSDTGNSWPVLDPVSWCLQNAHQPILERAAEGLGKLTASDSDRIVRLVVRRCGLNLLEVQADQVVIHYWGQNGLADLRPFFKSHGQARHEVEVVVRDRKKEVITTQTGDDFLYGVLLAPDFPLDLFQKKWGRRFEQEADDWQAAPNTSSGYAWVGIEDGCIPWIALKSAWRRSAPATCLNCDGPTILTNFGLRSVGMFNRTANFISVCSKCSRSFKDESVRDVAKWMAMNLDASGPTPR